MNLRWFWKAYFRKLASVPEDRRTGPAHGTTSCCQSTNSTFLIHFVGICGRVSESHGYLAKNLNWIGMSTRTQNGAFLRPLTGENICPHNLAMDYADVDARRKKFFVPPNGNEPSRGGSDGKLLLAVSQEVDVPRNWFSMGIKERKLE